MYVCTCELTEGTEVGGVRLRGRTHKDVFVLIRELDLEVAGSRQHRLDCPHPVVIVKLAGELQREREKDFTTRGSPQVVGVQ